MGSRITITRIRLDDGTTILVESTALGREEEDVAFDPLAALPFDHMTAAIESIAKAVIEPIKRVKPKKAQVEFGLAIGLEAGDLTALWVKGEGTANLKITLEWGE